MATAPIYTPLPPAPARTQAPTAFATTADVFVAALALFQTEGDALGVFTEEQAANALAAALGGDLPPLTGKALQFLRVNAGETASEFAVAVGKNTISVPADGLRPTTTNGAEAGSEELPTNDVPIAFLAFDDSTEEYAGFYFRTPKSYNGGTILVEFEWYSGVTTGNVIWGAQAVCVGNDDPLDVAYGTAQEVTDAAGSAVNDLMISAQTAAITVAAAAAEELMMVKIYRKAADGSDTLVGDAKLTNITAIYTADELTDD